MRSMSLLISLVCLGTTAYAAGTSPLPKADVLKAVRGKNPNVGAISDVLADLGSGRFPVLYWDKGGSASRAGAPGLEDASCPTTAEPHIAIVRRTADTNAPIIEADLKLPTADTPCMYDKSEAPRWGITVAKDCDGDGQPELVVVYDYSGQTEPGVGSTYYRHLAVVNLADKLSLSIAVLLRRQAEGTDPELESTWKFVPSANGKPTLLVKVTKQSYDRRKAQDVSQTATVTYGWDAATDRFIKR